MKWCHFLLVGISFILMTLMASESGFAYEMREYWSLDEGDTWVYDRDLIVFTADTHRFGARSGNRLIFGKEYCGTQPYIYQGPEGVLAIGLYDRESGQLVDIADNPLTLARADMRPGQSVSTTWPAGVIDDDAISFTITLEAPGSVTVPAGTFSDTLRLRIVVDDGMGVYEESIWLAKGIGLVKMYRVSETNDTPGCMFTCGALSCESDTVEQRTISLISYTQSGDGHGTEQKPRIVVVPLGD